tara:strand:+ start:4584 stop:5471 length:888 start_codon:yes stop_codon:yes gene_type:complete
LIVNNMKVLKFIFLSFLLIVLLFIFSLNNIKNQKFISIENFELIEEKTNHIVIDCDFKIFNPNWYNVKTNDVIFKLYSDTIYFGDGKLNNNIILPKKDTVLLSSTLKINKSILNSFDNLEDHINLNVFGSTSFPIISKRYYFNISEKFSIGEYLSLIISKYTENLDLQINRINFKKINLQNSHLDIGIRIYNNSKFNFNINKLDIEIYETDEHIKKIGMSKIKESFLLESDTFNDFSSFVEINTLKMASMFIKNSLKNKSSIYVKVKTIVNYNNLEIPFSSKKKIDFNPLTFEIY